MPLNSPRSSAAVAEMAAPYHHRAGHSIRAIQQGAAALLERLSAAGHLTEDEASHLRAGDVDFAHQRVMVRDFDGHIRSSFPIPENAATSLRVHLEGVRLNHERDRIQGLAGVWVPAGDVFAVGFDFRYHQATADLDPNVGFFGDKIDVGGYASQFTLQLRF